MVIGKKELNIRTTPPRTTKSAWVISGLVVVALLLVGWWFVKPNPTQSASSAGGVLATAPATPPQPLNADGAPRSD
jgi:hypothetical protein